MCRDGERDCLRNGAARFMLEYGKVLITVALIFHSDLLCGRCRLATLIVLNGQRKPDR